MIPFLLAPSFGYVATSVPDVFSLLFHKLFTSHQDFHILFPMFFIWRYVPDPTVTVSGVVRLGELVKPGSGHFHAFEPAAWPLRALFQRSEQRF